MTAQAPQELVPIKSRNRLAYKLTRNVIVACVVLGFLLNIAQLSVDYINEKEESISFIDQVFSSIENAATLAAYNYDEKAAEEVIKGLLQYESIVQGNISSDTGETLAASRKATIRGEGESGSWLYTFRDFEHSLYTQQGSSLLKVGKLRVVVDESVFKRDFIRRAVVTLVAGLLRNTLLALLLVFVIHWTLVKRLVVVKQQLERVNPDNPGRSSLTTQTIESMADELDQVVVTVNNLMRSIARQINIRQHAEAEVRQLNDTLAEKVKARTQELESANGELRSTLEELRTTQRNLIESEKLASLGSMVAGVAHEINTPIGVGITASSSLTDEVSRFSGLYNDQKMKRSDLDQFLRSTQELSEIILNNLRRSGELVKSFKRVAADQTCERCCPFNVYERIEEVFITLKPELKKTTHNLEVLGARDVVLCNYPGAFAQVLTILVMNSLMHAYENKTGGQMQLSYELQSSGELEVVFTDDGCGIEASFCERIFEPFVTTKRGRGGTGLGLHILYNTVTQMLKGSVRCSSELGVGTRFVLTIPPQAETPLSQHALDS